MSSFTPEQQGELNLLLRQQEDAGILATKIRQLQSAGGVSGPPGPAGPAGPPGAAGPAGSGGDLTFHYVQGVAAATWGPIAHNLGKFPSVSVVTSAGDEVEGEVHYVDVNHVTLLFAASFSGDAYFN